MSTTSSPDRRTRRAIRHRHPRPPVTRWRSRLRDDRGSATAEYAVVILAAIVHKEPVCCSGPWGAPQ